MQNLLFIAYSDEERFYYQFSPPPPYISSLNGWENFWSWEWRPGKKSHITITYKNWFRGCRWDRARRSDHSGPLSTGTKECSIILHTRYAGKKQTETTSKELESQFSSFTVRTSSCMWTETYQRNGVKKGYRTWLFQYSRLNNFRFAAPSDDSGDEGQPSSSCLGVTLRVPGTGVECPIGEGRDSFGDSGLTGAGVWKKSSIPIWCRRSRLTSG